MGRCGCRTKRHMQGGSLKSLLGKVHKFVKDKKLLSKGLRFGSNFGPLKKYGSQLSTAANMADMAGYGRRRGRRRRRVRY